MRNCERVGVYVRVLFAIGVGATLSAAWLGVAGVAAPCAAIASAISVRFALPAW